MPPGICSSRARSSGAAGRQVAEDGLVEATAGLAADILEAGVVADLGGLEQAGQPAILAVRPLAVDEGLDDIDRRHVVRWDAGEELLEAGGHTVELHPAELAEGLLVDHGRLLRAAALTSNPARAEHAPVADPWLLPAGKTAAGCNRPFESARTPGRMRVPASSREKTYGPGLK